MRGPYGVYRDRETAFRWAHHWYRVTAGVRYSVRMWWVPGERSPRWRVAPSSNALRRNPA